jgi:hypothetical protein
MGDGMTDWPPYHRATCPLDREPPEVPRARVAPINESFFRAGKKRISAVEPVWEASTATPTPQARS